MGSSGAMKSKVVLRLTESLHQKWDERVYITGIVSDDDSTIFVYLQHTDINQKGKLHSTIPEPTFMSDPSYRIKVISPSLDELHKNMSSS